MRENRESGLAGESASTWGAALEQPTAQSLGCFVVEAHSSKPGAPPQQNNRPLARSVVGGEDKNLCLIISKKQSLIIRYLAFG